MGVSSDWSWEQTMRQIIGDPRCAPYPSEESAARWYYLESFLTLCEARQGTQECKSPVMASANVCRHSALRVSAHEEGGASSVISAHCK